MGIVYATRAWDKDGDLKWWDGLALFGVWIGDWGLRLDLGIWSGLGFFWIRDSLKGLGFLVWDLGMVRGYFG